MPQKHRALQISESFAARLHIWTAKTSSCLAKLSRWLAGETLQKHRFWLDKWPFTATLQMWRSEDQRSWKLIARSVQDNQDDPLTNKDGQSSDGPHEGHSIRKFRGLNCSVCSPCKEIPDNCTVQRVHCWVTGWNFQ